LDGPSDTPSGFPTFEYPGTQPQGEGGSARPRRLRPVLIAVGAAFVVAAIGIAAFAFIKLRGTGDVLVKMAPADAQVYATAYLDPSAGQKLALRNLVRKFPALKEEEDLRDRVEHALDDVLSGTGLTYRRDVEPWLGSQIAVVVRIPEAGAPEVLALIGSKDDGKAEAALGRFRERTGAELGERWTSRNNGGVTVHVGTASGGSLEGVDVHAVVDHTVAIGSGTALIEDVIDADGGAPGIESTAAFQQVVDLLPEDRLGFAFVNLPPLVARLEQSVGQSGIDIGGLGTGVSNLEAARGLGFSIGAQDDGLEAEMATVYDPSKLTSEQRRSLGISPHRNEVLDWTPERAFAVFALAGFQETARQAVQSIERASPEFERTDRRLGLSGPGGVIGGLTGDAGFEMGPGSNPPYPSGALLLGTSDEAGMMRFFQKLSGMASEGLAGSESSGDGSIATLTLKPAPGRWEKETYRGVTITFLPRTDLDQFGVVPAYAVANGMGILASSPDEVKAILDAHENGPTIDEGSNFRPVTRHADVENNGMFFADVEAIVRAIRDSLPPDDQQRFDQEVQPNLEPVRAFVQTTRNDPDHSTVRMFVLIR
jgi:uncharacterized protein DUF3352